MDYSKLTDAELDDLVATRVMGWHRGPNPNYPPSMDLPVWLDANGEIAHSRYFFPVECADDMLLVLPKVLADGYRIIMETPECLDGLYRVGVRLIDGNIWFANASTLPRALCEAVVAAYEVKK